MAEQLNKYQRKRIEIKTTKMAWEPVEGVGIGATYELKGYIDISEYNKNLWRAQTYVQIRVNNSGISGTIHPFGYINMYTNGRKGNDVTLTLNSSEMKLVEAQWLQVGSASVMLPNSGSVEIEVNAGYMVEGIGGNYVVNNTLGKIMNMVSKKLGRVFGHIRVDIC